MQGIEDHADVFLLVELPFALNAVNLRVSVPIPTEFLDRAISHRDASPQVHLTITNLTVDEAAVAAGGQGLQKFSRDLGEDDLANAIAAKTRDEGRLRTLVQAQTTACRLDGEGQYPSDEAAVLERVIYALNRVLHAYLIAFEDQVAHFISREHVVSPVLLSSNDFSKPNLSDDIRVMDPPGRSFRFEPRDAEADELERFRNAAGIEPFDHPMDTVRLWLLDARRARAAGDGDHAIVALQTSAERLLFGAHQLILLDEGLTSDELLARQMATPFKSLLTGELPARLGGRWQLDGAGPVARYWSDLYEARNVVAHAGYRLHRQHVDDAFDAYDAVEAHLIERAIAKKHQFPRLAFGLLGGPGLQKRGALSKRLREWAAEAEKDPRPFWVPPEPTVT